MHSFDTILSDLGFAPGDEVIDADLLGELESVVGTVKKPEKPTSGKWTQPRKPASGGTTIPPEKPTQPRKPASGGTTIPPEKPVASDKAADYKKAVDDYDKKVADASRRVASAQASLKTAVASTVDKANKLKSKVRNLASKPALARTAKRLSNMADNLLQSSSKLRALADKKLLKRKGPRALSAAEKGAAAPLRKKLLGEELLGQILEDLLGEAYDPSTSERDPQTVAEAQALVDAAQKYYDEVKKEEVDAGAALKEAMQESYEDVPDEDRSAAFSATYDAGIVRGEAGQMVMRGRELLAALKDQPNPPPDPTGGAASLPPPGGGGSPPPPSTGDSTPPGTGEPAPPGTEATPPGTEAAPPGTGEAPPPDMGEPLSDPYGGFVDPFAGVPGSAERMSRGRGGSGDDFVDQGGDPDRDVETTERVQDKAYRSAMRSVRAQRQAPVDALPEFEGTPEETGAIDTGDFNEEVEMSEQGVVGSYLHGTTVLIGGTW